MSASDAASTTKTAFVFAGGGSFGAIQVGMLQSLVAHGVTADMVVGSSVGALNGAFYAGDPTVKGMARLAGVWRDLKRQDVFPVTWRTMLGFLWRRDFLITHDGIRKLIDDHIPFSRLEQARLPVHVVTTDIITGDAVVFSEGPTSEAIVASTAIPGAFAPIRYGDRYLADGAISSNTPIRVAIAKGARRLIVLPTGHACANDAPPIGAVANALHALTLHDRAPARQRARKPRPPDRVLRGAAAVPAGRLALRFLAHSRAYRARHPGDRRVAGARRPDEAGNPARIAAPRPLNGRPRCTAIDAAGGPGRAD